MNKYKAIKTTIDGINFASKKEAEHYADLKKRLNKREITDLMIQPIFPIEINGVKICRVILDFKYWDVKLKCWMYIDVKGMYTAISRLKHKMCEAQHRILVTIV